MSVASMALRSGFIGMRLGRERADTQTGKRRAGRQGKDGMNDGRRRKLPPQPHLQLQPHPTLC
jgi:hypothetical protein